MEKLLHSEITERIIQSYFTINKVLPYGLPIEYYKNALFVEMEFNHLVVETNYSIILKYRNNKIGEMRADFLIEEKVLVMIVSIDSINKLIEDQAKLMLRGSKYEVCLILNSIGDYEYKRILFTNDYKKKGLM